MIATIPGMAKTEQIRIPTDITGNARICAQALYGESLPEYVARVLKEAVARDLPKAAEKISELAKGEPSPKPKKARGE